MTTSPTTSTTTTADRRSTATPTSRRDRSGRRRRASSAALLGAALLLVAPVLAACSTAADDPTAGASSGAQGSTSSASAQLGSCLRDAGFDVDDPDLSRGMVIAPPAGVDIDAYVTAFTDCRAELPADQGGQPAPSADDLAALQEANLEVARCVREKGFTDFADPVDGVFPSGTSMSTDPSARGAQDEAFLACSEEHGPNSAGAGR
ncbi:hypothetical protein [Frigoribacterium endophyticum]|uniref:hypothetical protein n=1 Tax=Frigoribacterium endophyticum TaxID=1522176 RepID=UPI00141E2F76|nr:hypothetical protein [Frigoribacterium endophyticum]NII52552.1 hypothetical protein [Frigoribacterium endophyticum]